MLILRRGTAVVLWLVAWLCGIFCLNVALYPIKPSMRLPTEYALTETIPWAIGMAIALFLIGIGAIILGRRLWRGDTTERWSPPRLALNFYLIGCYLFLIYAYATALFLGAEPNNPSIWFPWLAAAAITAMTPPFFHLLRRNPQQASC
jgi:hypothetical protein